MRTVSLLLLTLLAGSLQGCFPVVATGVGTSVLMAQDRRTSGAYIEDQSIEIKAIERIEKQFKTNVHFNVTSFNRTVLITGEAPSESTKTEIGRIVAGIDSRYCDSFDRDSVYWWRRPVGAHLANRRLP